MIFMSSDMAVCLLWGSGLLEKKHTLLWTDIVPQSVGGCLHKRYSCFFKIADMKKSAGSHSHEHVTFLTLWMSEIDELYRSFLYEIMPHAVLRCQVIKLFYWWSLSPDNLIWYQIFITVLFSFFLIYNFWSALRPNPKCFSCGIACLGNDKY